MDMNQSELKSCVYFTSVLCGDSFGESGPSFALLIFTTDTPRERGSFFFLYVETIMNYLLKVKNYLKWLRVAGRECWT